MLEKTEIYDDIQQQFSLRGRQEGDSVFSGNSLSSFTFLCVVVALVGFGLVSMYSASYNEALGLGLPSSYFFVRQLVFAVFGFACFVMIQFIPLPLIRKLVPYILLVSVVLMLLTIFTPLGVTRLGARRWIEIGPLPSFQPSELLKISTVLFLALHFSKHATPRLGIADILLPAVIVLGSALLIIAQKDYSTMLVFLGVGFAIFMVAGLSLSWLVLFLFAIGGPAIVFLLIEPYRVRRLVSFLFPQIDPTGLNWQVNNSLQAIASGGFWGKGLGKGTFKLGSLPEVQSDFIFANIVEEMGIPGVLMVFLLFFLFAFLGFRTFHTQWHTDRFASYVAFGVSCLVVWQAMVNVAVVTGLLPPTGITLPFFSQGGTSLFVVICESALLYKIMAGVRKERLRMVVEHE
jgi:cell division protein FtsW